jgi:hypothetical protein
MKPTIFLLVMVVLFSCNNNKTPDTAKTDTPVEEKTSFFPVTAYIKGQVHDIRQKGLTPYKFITVNDRTDSALIQFSQLDSLIQEFLHPEIDSVNLQAFFTENRFLDQSINAFTFTYNPKGKLPDSIPLKHWDVYIDPENNKVKRLYLVKQANKNTLLQLTWQSNQWCKTTTIITSPDGTEKVAKEEKISWDY